MFSNRVVLVPLSDIRIDREVRQRTDLTPESVLSLAESIATSQWIAPVLIDQDTNKLVAGERRFTAVSLLRAAVNGDYSAFEDPSAAKAILYPIQSCKIESWDNWSKIPSQLGSNFTQLDLLSYEFIENHQRKDLSWQDKARAVYQIHAEGLKANGGDWNNQSTAKITGLDHSGVAKYLRVWRPMIDNPSPEIKLIINESPTLLGALQSLKRYLSRRSDDAVTLALPAVEPGTTPDDINKIKKPGPAPGTPKVEEGGVTLDDELDWDAPIEPKPAPVSFAEQMLVLADAHDWVENYTGQPFNFLHCDFPYGIDFNTGAQGKSVDAKLTGDYDDSPDIFWNLLDTLAEYQGNLIAESAHVMFWYSQNLEDEIEAYFAENFPRATLQRFKMIWHCSDGDGIVPDPQRYGRRTYETAMLLTFGDRKIVTPKALSFSAPRNSKNRHHRSMKPLPVLTHFMSMFVDDASSVLDLTAGSGTSLLAAHNLGATRITGLEISEESYKAACRFLNERQGGVSL